MPARLRPDTRPVGDGPARLAPVLRPGPVRDGSGQMLVGMRSRPRTCRHRRRSPGCRPGSAGAAGRSGWPPCACGWRSGANSTGAGSPGRPPSARRSGCRRRGRPSCSAAELREGEGHGCLKVAESLDKLLGQAAGGRRREGDPPPHEGQAEADRDAQARARGHGQGRRTAHRPGLHGDGRGCAAQAAAEIREAPGEE